MNERITRRTLDDIRKDTRKDRTDWERVDRLTDAEIDAAIALDPDAVPPLDSAWFKHAKLVLPERKEPVSLRVDADVLRWYKDQGPGYQSRMNAVLRQYATAHGAKVAGRSLRARRVAGKR